MRLFHANISISLAQENIRKILSVSSDKNIKSQTKL